MNIIRAFKCHIHLGSLDNGILTQQKVGGTLNRHTVLNNVTLLQCRQKPHGSDLQVLPCEKL